VPGECSALAAGNLGRTRQFRFAAGTPTAIEEIDIRNFMGARQSAASVRSTLLTGHALSSRTFSPLPLQRSCPLKGRVAGGTAVPPSRGNFSSRRADPLRIANSPGGKRVGCTQSQASSLPAPSARCESDRVLFESADRFGLPTVQLRPQWSKAIFARMRSSRGGDTIYILGQLAVGSNAAASRGNRLPSPFLTQSGSPAGFFPSACTRPTYPFR